VSRSSQPRRNHYQSARARSMSGMQLAFDRRGLDVHPSQEPGHDVAFGHAPDPRYGHHQLAVDASHAAIPTPGEYELGGAMESTGILLRLEAQRAGAPRPDDPYLLDPGQRAGADEPLCDGVEAPGERIPEPKRCLVAVEVLLEELGLAQIREPQAEVEGRVGQDRPDGSSRCGEPVLSVESHGPMLSRSDRPGHVRWDALCQSYSRSGLSAIGVCLVTVSRPVGGKLQSAILGSHRVPWNVVTCMFAIRHFVVPANRVRY
jgi:hypothetical protein